MKLQSSIGSIRATGLIATLVLAAGAGVFPVTAHAAPAAGTVDLLATPPELTATVSPNLVLTFDDSGSMGNTYMGDYRPFYAPGTNTGWGSASASNPWVCAGAIDPRSSDPADPRSLPMNGVYFNPNSVYNPPMYKDGLTSFPQSPWTAAWDNGIVVNRPTSPTSSTTRNLGSYSGFCGSKAGYYRLKSTTTLAFDSATGRLDSASLTKLYTAANWEWVAVLTTQQSNFANWYSYYRNRQNSAITSVSRAFAPFDQNVRVAWQNINSNQIGATTKIYKFVDDATTNNVRTNFYNWLFAIPASGGTPNQAAADRAGKFYQRATGAADTNPYWDRDLNRELSCRQNFHIQMTDGLWNGSTVNTATDDNDPTSRTLPDGRTYSTTAQESKIMSNELGPNARSMADIAFHYWATDLRPDFTAQASTRLKVSPYIPDKSLSLFGGTPLAAGDDPRNKAEIYWNPVNDPASWSHMVNFMIGFGASGTILQNDANYDRLRRGQIAWPATVLGTDDDRKIDDMWHAAINSRGQFFTASSPDELVTALTNIIASIIARRGSSTPATISIPLITDTTTSYKAGYDTTDWSGTLTRVALDPVTGAETSIVWDAACLLTGGTCPSRPLAPATTPRDPNSRIVITTDGPAGTGKPFRWANLSTQQRLRLNVNPATIRLDLLPQTWTADAYGSQRVDYIRGERTYESTPAPKFRSRSSVMGAVLKGEPEYVSSPISGHRDSFPSGSPEAVAAASGDTYAKFQSDNKSRSPTVYVAANDGNLHAFNAMSGVERWAYVPNIIINNFNLTKYTQSGVGLVPTVDDRPRQIDAFINGSWKTVLTGTTRLGGRGVFALDVTNPAMANEAGAASVAMWEFSNVDPSGGGGSGCAEGDRFCSSLGYTYDSVNVTRIKYQDKWVMLVSSGYFPTDPLDPSSRETVAGQTSLMVIDLATGQLIREIKTSSAPQPRPVGFKTFGLSAPIVYDFGSNQIADLAVAGDLAGNLWRFDLSDANPSNWKVDLMFADYGSGGAANAGDQPFSFNPSALRDPVTRGPIFVIGTGKYIGLPDRTSAIPMQSYYGIRDYGTNSTNYPIQVNQLVSQTLVQDGNGVRSITTENPVPDTKRGWRIPINIASEPGERAERRAFPLYSSNQVLLYTLIPKGVDPCDPGNRFGLMVVSAATGSVRKNASNYGSTGGVVGGVISAPNPPRDPITSVGGGGNEVPLPIGVADEVKEAIKQALSDDVWHRGAWRELLDFH